MLPSLKPNRSQPTYSLRDINDAIRSGGYWITRQAGSDAGALELDEDDIKDCVLNLRDQSR
jgi:hypothetical protein